MGKLIEKLRQVGQGNGGSFGFFGRGGQAASAPARPAAILVTLTGSQSAAAEAVGKSGADAVVIAGWKPSDNVSAIKAALAGAGTLWGVAYDGGAANDDEVAAAAQQAGAGFLLLGPDAPASALYEQREQFDRVITLSAPVSEMDLLLYRMANALPAQAAIIPLPVGMRDLPKLSVREAARLALLSSSVRFPLLAQVDEAPDERAARALVRLGFDGVVLSGVGASAELIGEQTRTLRADLEKIPLSEGQEREGVSLGGLIGGVIAAQQKPAEPEKDPEHE